MDKPPGHLDIATIERVLVVTLGEDLDRSTFTSSLFFFPARAFT